MVVVSPPRYGADAFAAATLCVHSCSTRSLGDDGIRALSTRARLSRALEIVCLKVSPSRSVWLRGGLALACPRSIAFRGEQPIGIGDVELGRPRSHPGAQRLCDPRRRSSFPPDCFQARLLPRSDENAIHWLSGDQASEFQVARQGR